MPLPRPTSSPQARSAADRCAVECQAEFTPKPYVEIPLNFWNPSGMEVSRPGGRYSDVRAGVYRSPGKANVEGDASPPPSSLAPGATGAGPGRFEASGA